MSVTTESSPKSSPVVYPGEIHFITGLEQLATDRDRVAEMRKQIQAGDIFIVRGAYSRAQLEPIRNYLTQVGRSSLPNYVKIEQGSPNFHRMNNWDPRAYVGGCFHQFAFFPWNQDVFGLFEMFRPVYHVKNMLSGLEPHRFLDSTPDEDCTARLSFQFYPKGVGGLNKHADPVDYHQLTVPTMNLGKKGVDFHEGGAYVAHRNGERVYLDDLVDWGDIVYFNAQTPHGVETIDPAAKQDWVSFEGRWMLLFAVNKLQASRKISDSVDLEDGPKH